MQQDAFARRRLHLRRGAGLRHVPLGDDAVGAVHRDLADGVERPDVDPGDSRDDQGVSDLPFQAGGL